ncbi:MAG: glucosaminidase domain-containing protein [Kangiellaceae bacterium]|nr:glucosaminidase domain-containing protein [Kangiellaceae bacterium]
MNLVNEEKKIRAIIKLLVAIPSFIALLSFSQYSNSVDKNGLSKQQKHEFIESVRSVVNKYNRKIKYKKVLYNKLVLKYSSGDFHSRTTLRKLDKIVQEFGFGNYLKTDDKDEVLHRMDIIPSDFVVAIAANDSNWGQSKKLSQTNNYFSKISKQLVENKPLKFKSSNASVEAFLSNVNKNEIFETLRNSRAGFRRRGQLFDGKKLIKSLEGTVFDQPNVAELISIIKHYNL